MNRRDGTQRWMLILTALTGVMIGVLVGSYAHRIQDMTTRLTAEDAIAVFSNEGQTSFSIAPVDVKSTAPQMETAAPDQNADVQNESASTSDQLEDSGHLQDRQAVSTPEQTAQETSPLSTPDASAFSIVPLGKMQLPENGRILIYHTHTYEAYELNQQNYQETERWRTADSEYNMVRVGEELAQLLRGLGYTVVHDTTAFEPPDLSSAYARSLAMLENRMEAGETYDLYIDLHRDAFVEGQTGANTVTAGGVETARLMLLIGKGEGYTDTGYDRKPDWEANLACAQRITDSLNDQVPSLCKEVRLKSGRFNQHVAKNCVLIEVGNNRNTLQQALAAMPYLADAIHAVLCP